MNTDCLYVSDLDGTLMRSDGTISPFTAETVNALAARGVAFTYATARSVESARTITGDLRLELPVITRNGCVLADNKTGKHLEKALFTQEEVDLLKKLLPELPHDISRGRLPALVEIKRTDNRLKGVRKD